MGARACFPPQGGRAVDWRRSLVRIHLTDEVLQPWEKRHWDSADPTSRAGGAPNFLPPAHLSPTTAAGRSRVQTMFIVKGKPRPPDGIMKVVKAARAEAFWAYSRRIAERPPSIAGCFRFLTLIQFGDLRRLAPRACPRLTNRS